MEETEWDDETYTVNRNRKGSNSFNTTLRSEYAQEYEDEALQQYHSGEYLVLRPKDRGEQDRIELDLPESLSNWSEQKRNTYIENALQAHIISGYNKIEIKYPKTWEKQFVYEITRQIQNLVDSLDSLSWDRKNYILTAESTDGFKPYARRVSSFIFSKLVTIINPDMEENLGNSPERMEKDIDAQWSQVTRVSTKQLFQLHREDYARALNNLYVSNYLERLVDEAQKIIKLFKEFENEDSQIYKYFANEITDICRGSSSFIDSDLEDLGNQVKRIAVRSYNLDIKFEDYTDEQELYDKHLQVLNKIKQKCLSMLENKEEKQKTQKEIGKIMIFIGKVLDLLKRLLKIPRSLAFVGVTFRKIGVIHGMVNEG